MKVLYVQSFSLHVLKSYSALNVTDTLHIVQQMIHIFSSETKTEEAPPTFSVAVWACCTVQHPSLLSACSLSEPP